MASDPRIGTEVAGYRIEAVLGRGGMGVVYLAEQRALGRKVALKLLTPELAEDPKFRERFLRESRIAASLEDPNILPIYEAGEAGGVLFIAMRHVRGTDLRAMIDGDGALSPERTVAILSQVAAALDAAHAEGLIHRDVKPGNILITPGSDAVHPDRVYLSDFGLTKRATSDSGVTGTGQFVGTLDYAAPEQFTGEPLTPQTDVYSLGCVLYECLTASMPFPRDREAAVLHAHLNESPPRPTHERPELPSAVDAVVAQAMAKKPEDRYRSAGDLARAAREALGVGPAQPSVKRSRVPALAIGGGLAAIVVVMVSLLFFARGGSTPAVSTGAKASPSSTPAVEFARGVLSIDPKTGAIGTRISGPGISFARTAPGVIAAGEGGIWTIEGLAVVHIDPRDGSAARISVNFPVSNIAIGDGAIWAGGATSAAGPDNLDRIDPATDEVRVELSNLGHFAATVTGVVAVGGTVWVADSTGELTRVSAGGTKAGRVVQLASDISGLALGEVSMWAIDALGGDVLKLSTRTGELENTIPVSGNLDALAVGLGSVWVIDSTAGTVLRIDAQTDQPSGPIRVGKYPTSVAVGFGAVWVTNQGDGTLSRIDPVTNESMPVQIGAPVSAVVADRQSGKLWVIVSQGPSGG